MNLQVLRHEEFGSGCEAECNGAYQRPWSKTMVGSGSEQENFAFELTFNYGITSYTLGKDLEFIDINKKLVNCSEPIIQSPEGYKFRLLESESTRIVLGICLNVSNMQKTVDFWSGTLGLKLAAFNKVQVGDFYIEFIETGSKIEHAQAYGRIAFAVSTSQLDDYEAKINKEGLVKTPRITLSTPGKADVDVVIALDHDGYEICLVGSEGFFELAIPTGDTIDWKYRRELGDS